VHIQNNYFLATKIRVVIIIVYNHLWYHACDVFREELLYSIIILLRRLIITRVRRNQKNVIVADDDASPSPPLINVLPPTNRSHLVVFAFTGQFSRERSKRAFETTDYAETIIRLIITHGERLRRPPQRWNRTICNNNNITSAQLKRKPCAWRNSIVTRALIYRFPSRLKTTQPSAASVTPTIIVIIIHYVGAISCHIRLASCCYNYYYMYYGLVKKCFGVYIRISQTASSTHRRRRRHPLFLICVVDNTFFVSDRFLLRFSLSWLPINKNMFMIRIEISLV